MHLSVYVYVAGNVGSCSGSMKVMHCCLVANKIYNHTKKHVDRKATRTLTGKMIEDMYMCMQSSMCVHFNVCVCAIRHGSACRCVFICFVCDDWLHVHMCIYPSHLLHLHTCVITHMKRAYLSKKHAVQHLVPCITRALAIDLTLLPFHLKLALCLLVSHPCVS